MNRLVEVNEEPYHEGGGAGSPTLGTTLPPESEISLVRFHDPVEPAQSTPGRAPVTRASLLGLAVVLVVCVAVGPACAGVPAPSTDGRLPPSLLLGTFEDDDGHRFEIAPQSWSHRPGARLEVVDWMEGERSILARTHPDDREGDGTLWTRIDWVRLDDIAPWTWGFCLVIWDAPTRVETYPTRPPVPEHPASP